MYKKQLYFAFNNFCINLHYNLEADAKEKNAADSEKPYE